MSSNQFSAGSEKRQFWQMVMETWQDSGFSVRQFCLEPRHFCFT